MFDVPAGRDAVPALGLERLSGFGNIAHSGSTAVNRRRQPPRERRTGIDRRKVDKGPPDGRDRRVGMEPRQPDVAELDLSPQEWAALAGLAPAQAPTTRDPDDADKPA